MGSATSLTSERIMELLVATGDIPGALEDLERKLSEAVETVTESQEAVNEFRQVTLPNLREELTANDNLLQDLRENGLVNLARDVEEMVEQVELVQQVQLPSLKEEVDSTTQNLIDRPKVYTVPVEPTNPDEEDRYLVQGDTWFNTSDNNKQRIWNGVEWTTFGIDVPDFSLNVRKFISSQHHIY